ncbi:MAG: CBS domain-containing protein [Methanosphaera sp.]|nr:CBS domain-containing protein [Methanosphaera sp.]
MLTSVQKEIMQTLINLYRQSKCTSVKCESIAELMGRNSGTIRNQMQSLRSLGLVQGVPGPRGGYKPTLEAYHALNIENDPCEIHVPIFVRGESIPDISVNKIEFTSILRPGDCEATISVLGNIKQLDLDDEIKIGPTPVNNLTVHGTIIGRDDVDNALLIKTNNILSIPNIQIKEVATPLFQVVGLDSTLTEVCELINKHNLTCIPVMVDNEVKGIVKYEDIIKMIAENKLDSKVEELLDDNVVLVKETNSLMHSMDMLYEKDVSILLLMNPDNDITGIVTIADILHRLVKFTN